MNLYDLIINNFYKENINHILPQNLYISAKKDFIHTQKDFNYYFDYIDDLINKNISKVALGKPIKLDVSNSNSKGSSFWYIVDNSPLIINITFLMSYYDISLESYDYHITGSFHVNIFVPNIFAYGGSSDSLRGLKFFKNYNPISYDECICDNFGKVELKFSNYENLLIPEKKENENAEEIYNKDIFYKLKTKLFGDMKFLKINKYLWYKYIEARYGDEIYFNDDGTIDENSSFIITQNFDGVSGLNRISVNDLNSENWFERHDDYENIYVIFHYNFCKKYYEFPLYENWVTNIDGVNLENIILKSRIKKIPIVLNSICNIKAIPKFLFGFEYISDRYPGD